jgi:hypothetical protein
MSHQTLSPTARAAVLAEVLLCSRGTKQAGWAAQSSSQQYVLPAEKQLLVDRSCPGLLTALRVTEQEWKSFALVLITEGDPLPQHSSSSDRSSVLASKWEQPQLCHVRFLNSLSQLCTTRVQKKLRSAAKTAIQSGALLAAYAQAVCSLVLEALHEDVEVSTFTTILLVKLAVSSILVLRGSAPQPALGAAPGSKPPSCDPSKEAAAASPSAGNDCMSAKYTHSSAAAAIPCTGN